MRIRIWFGMLLAVALASAAAAQKVDLKLDALAAKAKEKAELDLDPSALAKLMEGGKLPNIAPASAREVRIRSYKFAQEGEYAEKDLEPLRSQITGGGWARLLQAREQKSSVELAVYKESDQIRAFILIACQPQEVSIVYVAGEFTPEQLKALVSSTIRYPNLP